MSEPDRPTRTGLLQFLREARQELAKVRWPSKREVFVYSLVVLATVIVLGLLVFLLDVVFSRLSVMLLEKRSSGLQLRSIGYQASKAGYSPLAARSDLVLPAGLPEVGG